MAEINGIKDQLDSNSLFESIKTTTNLDSDALIKSYDEQVSENLNKSI